MPTAQLMGRWQPWHEGHQALLERALDKCPQVYLMIRDMPTDSNNPYTASQVMSNLRTQLVHQCSKIKIAIVPNITNITYGRKVGYTIEQEGFDKDVEDISATKIRNGEIDSKFKPE